MGRLRILVTGGAGFIGSNFARAALSAGYQITVLDDLSIGDPRYLEGLPVRFVEGSILDEQLVRKEVPNHTAVVHLAAQSGIPSSLANPRHDCQLNILGTLNLLEACRATQTRAAVPRFVFASSNAVLGRQLPPAREDKTPLPASPYGASKLAGEAYCLAYHLSWDLSTIALRFGNVYGPYSAHKTSVVASFFRDLEKSDTVTIYGDGRQTRDFIYVRDLCRALLKAVESKLQGEVFQISSATEISILELSSLIGTVVGRDVKVALAPARKAEARRNRSDIGKAKSLLGWRPQVSLKEGLRQTYEWRQSWSCLEGKSTTDSRHQLARGVDHS